MMLEDLWKIFQMTLDTTDWTKSTETMMMTILIFWANKQTFIPYCYVNITMFRIVYKCITLSISVLYICKVSVCVQYVRNEPDANF